MALTPGTKLGPYEIQSLLGAGGMGEVYRARDSRLQRDVAVKVLPRALSRDADRLRRFEQEALATATLNHPNILAVFDIGTSDGLPYVVSELLEGETLRERLRSGAIPLRKALDYALQTAHGLAAAQEKGIIHRDLKPENLFLTKDGRLKILDFGLAKLTQTEPDEQASIATVSDGTEAGVVLGTVGYMSPEQVRGQSLDGRSDIFSLGAILYEMLSGQRAFCGDTPADTMSAILKEEPAELSTANRNVSPALERIVQHCLEKSPEARFHSASDLGFDLEHLSGISASSATLAPIEAAPPSRRRLLGRVSALPLALMMLGLGWWLGQSGARQAPPEFKRITFRTGAIGNARFAPDGSVVFSAWWDGGGQQLYLNRENDPSARELGLKDAELLSVSRNGELAVRLRTVHPNGLIELGTLARVPLSGGMPREVLDNVIDADWAGDGENLAVARFIPANAHWHLEYPIGKVLLDSINWISTPKISPNGKWIAFADHENNIGDDEGSIAVIATDGEGREKKLSTGWESIEGIAWASAEEVWYTSTMSGFATNPRAVTVSGKLRNITNVPGGMVLQDVRNGTALAVVNLSGRGIRALAPGTREERELGWFGWSLLAAIAPDGRKALFFDVGEAGGTNYTVFLRDTDGAPPATLGQGRALALSPDAKWIVTQPARGGSLNLVPTGAGQSKTLTHDSVNYNRVSFLPDGKWLLASGIEAGHGERDYLIAVNTGDSKPVTPDGISGVRLSPDGRAAAVRGPDGKWGVWPLDGSSMRPIPRLTSEYDVVNWSSDGGSVYVEPIQTGKIAKIYKVNVTTGKMDPWKTLGTEAAGIQFVSAPLISAEGNAYAYTYAYQTSQAYVVTGLR
ncbi:MAG TPA: protein kinase [Terriglobales bacterium]|nr:protein kinase [Terriglobales bacterium]